MITTKVKVLEGVRFRIDVSLEEPFEYRHWVRVEKVSRRLLDNSKEFRIILKALGFREVEEEPWTDSVIFAQYPVCYIRYKAVQFLVNSYWKILLFLYDNARLFKRIPEGEQFSWRYFTPYTWFKAIWDKVHRKEGGIYVSEQLEGTDTTQTFIFPPDGLSYSFTVGSTTYIPNYDIDAYPPEQIDSWNPNIGVQD